MEKLGVNFQLLLTQIVNFLIVLFILNKFLYKPILKALDNRNQKIKAGLDMAAKMQQEKEKLAQLKQDMLKEVQEEAKVIMKNTQEEAQRLKDEAVEQGKKEVADLKHRMAKELQAQTDKLRKELTANTVNIAAAMSKTLLGNLLSTEDQHRLIMAQLKQIQRKYEKQSK